MYILSICIPTYNRSENLIKTIDSIVSQPIFNNSNKIQIVVSNNGSNDETENVCKKYQKKYGNNLKYVSFNEKKSVTTNVLNVLKNGDGEFLKLNNDTLIHSSNSLEIILQNIEKEKSNKNQILFFNNSIKQLNKHIFINKDEFIENISFKSTWIGAYGFWKKDFININFIPHSEFPHLELFFEIFQKRKCNIIICNERIFTSLIPKKKGGYNLYDVFLNQYILLNNKYCTNSKIIKKEKEKVFFNFIIPWHLKVLLFKKYNFETKNFIKIIKNKFDINSVFILKIIYYVPFHLFKIIKEKS